MSVSVSINKIDFSKILPEKKFVAYPAIKESDKIVSFHSRSRLEIQFSALTRLRFDTLGGA